MQGLGTASFLHTVECDTALLSNSSSVLTVGLVLQALCMLLLVTLMSRVLYTIPFKGFLPRVAHNFIKQMIVAKSR